MRDCCADGVYYVSLSLCRTQRGQDTIMCRMYRKHFPEESKVIPFKEFKEMYLLLSNGKLVDDRCAHILTIKTTGGTISSHRPTGSFIPNYTTHMWFGIHKSKPYPRRVLNCVLERKRSKEIYKSITSKNGELYKRFNRIPIDLVDIVLSYYSL